MSSVPPPLLFAVGADQQSRSASAVAAKAAWGFHVFRVDSYSVTTNLPGGEGITSEPFWVGGRRWQIDYYPNGTDDSKDSSDSIALYLRLQGSYGHKAEERVPAEYKFSLLDAAATTVYELPRERGVFTFAGRSNGRRGYREEAAVGGADPAGCGYASFITKEDQGKRSKSLLEEDSLAIRCDVGVVEMAALAAGPRKQRRSLRPRDYDYDYGSDSLDEYDGWHEGKRSQPPQDDKEFILRCVRRKY